MEISMLNIKTAEVNGTKPKSLRRRRAKSPTHSKRAEQGTNLTRFLKSFMGVFSDDFATVDFCEPRATIASTDQAYNFKGKRNTISLYQRVFSCERKGFL